MSPDDAPGNVGLESRGIRPLETAGMNDRRVRRSSCRYLARDIAELIQWNRNQDEISLARDLSDRSDMNPGRACEASIFLVRAVSRGRRSALDELECRRAADDA